MTLQLISGVLSNNAAKVRSVLAEKSLDYETIEVPWRKATAWQPKPEVLLQHNPRGQVPVLLHDDLVLWDSTIINEYLDATFPQLPLIPENNKEKALCRLWEDEGDFHQGSVGTLIQEVFLAPAGGTPNEAAQAAYKNLQAFETRLAEQLQSQVANKAPERKNTPTICSTFSVADISVFYTFAFATTLGMTLEKTVVQDWYGSMMARDSIKSEVEAIMTAVAAL